MNQRHRASCLKFPGGSLELLFGRVKFSHQFTFAASVHLARSTIGSGTRVRGVPSWCGCQGRAICTHLGHSV
jgi:hypothetical protein